MATDMNVEVKIIQPGRTTAIYELSEDGRLRLKEIVLPEVPILFDLAVLPNTLDINGENLQLILIGDISHPPQAHVTTRILGGVQKDGTELYLFGVAAVDQDFAYINQIADLPNSLQEEVLNIILPSSQNSTYGEDKLQWLEADTAFAEIQQAIGRFRQMQLESDRETSAQPSWRPADRKSRIVSYTELEHYTDAEYTYFQLPYRFQHYIDQHLAPDERSLFALSRPEMKSEVRRTWLGRKQLQQGVVILTNQRLVFLVELIPPDSSGVRYGFESNMGVLERLHAAALKQLTNHALILSTSWSARSGVDTLGWEFPKECQPSLEKLLDLLNKFLADSQGSIALRRAALPPSPESITPLKDPAANDPNAVEPIVQRFYSSLASVLAPGEAFIAWSMLPAWFEKKGYARVLLITNRRIRVIPDPIRGLDPEIDLPHEWVASLAYTSSILSSHIDISFLGPQNVQQVVVNFPYPAEHGFHTCFEAMRRCVAVVPI